ncbi:hypothetical protein ES332_D08G074500v1 [Gossypium tomentosum]|uniref:Uncharacterized protein n=1 Tax=Gossypium tomentosum TaxID=34277 RepID=A0A5D2JS36_GOSTO|nr:hypothetical protein ES332_D08G074500v1 [Gossypium tomentosum]
MSMRIIANLGYKAKTVDSCMAKHLETFQSHSTKMHLKSIEDGTFGNKKIYKQVINNQNGDVDMEIALEEDTIDSIISVGSRKQ